MKFSFNSNKKPLLTHFLQSNVIALSVTAALSIGAFLSTNAIAETQQSDASLQIASTESATLKQKIRQAHAATFEIADDNESGSHHVEDDNRIGAFSTKDGAMMGAYGDGEYAD